MEAGTAWSVGEDRAAPVRNDGEKEIASGLDAAAIMTHG